MIQLNNQHTRVEIDEHQGGRIAQIHINGLTLLVGNNQQTLAWGCYPMLPWVGRLQNGQLHWQGRQYHLPVNFEGHAIHGTCFNRAWSVREHSTHHCVLEIDLGQHWPFKGKAIQTFYLSENSLQLELTLFALEQPFPACMGWHPWFKRQLERGAPLQLQFEAEQQFGCDTQLIPTGKLIPPAPAPWDDCFLNPLSTPRLTWPNALQLEIESPCTHWVVYSKPQHALCVEPQIGAANLVQAITVTPDAPLCAQANFKWRLF